MPIDFGVGPYTLAVLSALLHAYWNFLIKANGGSSTFVGLSKVAESVIFAPVFLWLTFGHGDPVPIVWARAGLMVSVAAILTLANYVLLARAYQAGDLSVAYPVSRGTALLILPLLGFLAFGERLDPIGGMGLVAILLGIAAVQWRTTKGQSAAADSGRRAIVYAVLAGIATAGYTVWDKRAIAILPTFTYFYAYSCLVSLAYAAYLLWRTPETLLGEWRTHRTAIVQVGVLNTVSYLLILAALKDGTSSYVVALRQLSIVFGVGLGWWRLGETVTLGRQMGLALLLFGCALIALAR